MVLKIITTTTLATHPPKSFNFRTGGASKGVAFALEELGIMLPLFRGVKHYRLCRGRYHIC
jgi:hypothetical protein